MAVGRGAGGGRERAWGTGVVNEEGVMVWRVGRGMGEAFCWKELIHERNGWWSRWSSVPRTLNARHDMGSGGIEGWYEAGGWQSHSRLVAAHLSHPVSLYPHYLFSLLHDSHPYKCYRIRLERR
jgi:hypothetical protein